nr:MAG TPA: hypothetical protein [Caudoviricetes sp.]
MSDCFSFHFPPFLVIFASYAPDSTMRQRKMKSV